MHNMSIVTALTISLLVGFTLVSLACGMDGWSVAQARCDVLV